MARYAIQYTGDKLPPEYEQEDIYEDFFWLEDTKTGNCVYTDGGEPEDMILPRSLSGLVRELNRLAEEIG